MLTKDKISKETKPKISVIMPVYNVEKYVRRAVESVLNQTYSNIEIIIINDGSTDSSGDICDRLQERYGNIKVIHQDNMGVSVAKNRGLKLATGKYIGFVDSDDYIDRDMYDHLYKTILREHADISACSWRNIYVEDVVEYNQSQRFNDCVSPQKALVREVKYELYIACNKLFRKEILTDVNFKINCSNGEDRLFVLQAIARANKIAYSFHDKYNYFHRSNSAGTKKFTDKDYLLVEVCSEIENMFHSIIPASLDVARLHTFHSRMQLLSMMNYEISKYMPYGMLLINDLKKNWVDFVVNNNYKVSDKIKYTLICMNLGLFCIIKKLIKLLKNDKTLFE